MNRIIRYFIDGDSMNDIAEQDNVSRQAIHTSIHIGLIKIQRKLGIAVNEKRAQRIFKPKLPKEEVLERRRIRAEQTRIKNEKKKAELKKQRDKARREKEKQHRKKIRTLHLKYMKKKYKPTLTETMSPIIDKMLGIK